MSLNYFLFFIIIIICSEKSYASEIDSRKLESDEFSNIRIHIDYGCLSKSPNNTDTKNLFQIAINKAKNALQTLVKVKRLEQPIYLPNLNIRTVRDLPEGYSEDCTNSLNVGLPYDLVIFIRGYDTSYDSDKDFEFAYSEIIRHLDNNIANRPIVGTMVYNLKTTNLEDEESKIQAMSTVFLHEFTHILGFNKTILDNKNLIYKESVKYRMNSNDREQLFCNGSTVLETAQKYFGCYNKSILKGIELDNINGKELNNEDSIHWSGRILMGDYMTADLYFVEQTISEITLALLVDLKWYQVNYYTGGLMRFGKNKGCDFFSKDCVIQDNNGLKTIFTNEFCSNIYEGDSSTGNTFGTCSSGRQSMAYCSNLYTNRFIKNKPSNQNYYRTGFPEKIDGFSPFRLIEFCPYSDSDISIDEAKYNYEGNCKIGNDRYGTSNQFIKHEYNDTSFCVFSSLIKQNQFNPDHVKNIIRANCYKMSCSKRSLTIHLENSLIVCPREGGIIKVDNDDSVYRGYIICPDYNLICTGTILCNNLFDCVEKESLVKSSTFNYDYTINKNVSIEITSDEDTSIKDSDVVKDKIYEEGDDGVCPKYCQQCSENKQCTICDSSYNVYIGTKEGDDEQINCSKDPPGIGYYYKNISNKDYYFKCTDNCITCKNATRCEQCYTTYYVNKTDGQCVEKIPGCIEYDLNSAINDPDNGNAPTYQKCSSCNNSDYYYCFNNEKTKCIQNPDINMSLYYPMDNGNYPCIQKCEEKFIKCQSCESTTCTVCNQSNHFINKKGNCVQNISNCEIHNFTNDNPECLHCYETNNYYCIKEDRTQCREIPPADYISYYKIENNEYSCVQLCNETFNSSCLECNNTHCTKCQEGYFLFEGRCLLNMTGCIDNKVINPVTKQLSCDECDQNSSYYCLNEDKYQNITFYLILTIHVIVIAKM